MHLNYYLICTLLLIAGSYSSAEPIDLDFSIPEEMWNGAGIGDLSNYIPPNNNLNNSTPSELKILRGDHKELFRVNGYRLLTRSRNGLNRESICKPHINPCSTTLDIAILNNFKLISILRVRITVLDINDNAPVFTSNDFTVDVPREATIGDRFILPHSTDLDIGQNGLQGYQLRAKLHTPPNIFFLDTSERSPGFIQPKLVLNSDLKRDTTRYFEYELVAFDGGTPLRSGSVDIKVNILERNKHSPVFQKSVYNASCLENTSIGSTILTVKAVDIDLGENGRVSYSFEGNHLFSDDGILEINESSGAVSIHSLLDYEIKKEYHYSIIARDHASEPLTGSAEITLFVNDINDSPPLISITNSGNLEIYENSSFNSFVALVSVSDQDSGDNAKVNCYIVNDVFDLILLYENEYQLVSVGNLDYETQTDYNVTIECTDIGEPPLKGSQKVRIFIKDLNDNSPEFEHQIYTASLRENGTTPVTVSYVKAVDKDSDLNGQINYKLDDRARRWLAINTSTGQIYTTTPLDHEVMNEFIFSVIAYDLGTPTKQSTAVFNLTIIDINDEAPRFGRPKYSFGTYENQEIGTEIGTVSARDPDNPPFDKFNFYIINDTFDAQSFAIHPTQGTIRTKKLLDREKRPSFLFNVGAKNIHTPFMSSMVPVTVHIIDRNDNKPVFLFPTFSNNTAHLPISAKRGQAFTKIKAIDADYGSNALLTYSIINGNMDRLFQLNEFDGSLSLQKHVDSYDISQWTLEILVKDNGKVPKTAVASLNVLLDRTPINVPRTSDRGNYKDGTHPVAKSGIVGHVKLIIIFACITAVIVILLVIIIFVIKYKHRKHESKKVVEFEVEDKEEFETHEPSVNIYDTCPIVSAAEEDKQRRSHIDSVLSRGRLHGTSESPRSYRSEEDMMEETPLNITEDHCSVGYDEADCETPEIHGIEDLKPMEVSSTDMQLYKLIKWLKEVQKNEKRMSENVTELSLPGSSARGSSMDRDTISPHESESGMFQRQAFLSTISPNNTFGRGSKIEPPAAKHYSLPFNASSGNKSPDFLALSQTLVKEKYDSDSESDELNQNRLGQPHCGISCKNTPRYLNSCKKGSDSGIYHSNQDIESPKVSSEYASVLKKDKVDEYDKSGSYSPNIRANKSDLDNKKGNVFHSPDENNSELLDNFPPSEDTGEVFEGDKSGLKQSNNSKTLESNPDNTALPNNYVFLDSFNPDKDIKKIHHDYTDVNMNDLNIGNSEPVV